MKGWGLLGWMTIRGGFKSSSFNPVTWVKMIQISNGSQFPPFPKNNIAL